MKKKRITKKILLFILSASAVVLFVIAGLYAAKGNRQMQTERAADEVQNRKEWDMQPSNPTAETQEPTVKKEDSMDAAEDYRAQQEENETELVPLENENMAEFFYYTELTDEIKERITGKSYPDTEEPLEITYEDLAYVHVLHYDFEGQVQEGELICSRAIAQDLTGIFRRLYDNQYPIEKIRLIDEYDADDEASMADNNTSCFNYRKVPGSTKLSNHAYGLAIDINPLYNPYVRTGNGETLISPDNAAAYADRSASFPYKIDKQDLCWQVFTEYGFTWGGSWNSSKDYQHFEKTD